MPVKEHIGHYESQFTFQPFPLTQKQAIRLREVFSIPNEVPLSGINISPSKFIPNLSSKLKHALFYPPLTKYRIDPNLDRYFDPITVPLDDQVLEPGQLMITRDKAKDSHRCDAVLKFNTFPDVKINFHASLGLGDLLYDAAFLSLVPRNMFESVHSDKHSVLIVIGRVREDIDPLDEAGIEHDIVVTMKKDENLHSITVSYVPFEFDPNRDGWHNYWSIRDVANLKAIAESSQVFVLIT